MQELPAITLSFWPIVFLIAGGQALFFSVLVLSSKTRQNANYYLGAFLFFFGYMLIFNFSYWTNYIHHFPHLFYTNLVLNYLFGPFLLLYIDALREQPKLQKWWWIHFLPAIIYFIYLSPFFFQTASQKTLNILGETPFPVFHSLKTIGWMGTFKVYAWHYLLYFTWKIHLYFKITKSEESESIPAETKVIRRNWLKILLILYATFLFSYLSYFIIANQPFFQLIHDYIISGIMTIAIYIIGYLGYRQPQIFSGDLLKNVFIPSKKYASSTLTQSAANSIEKALIKFMEKEKPYRDNELKMKDLAEKLNTSPHHLSQVINEKFGKSFNQFINELRIAEAKNLLHDPANKKTYIIQIAYQVGFNNKTTFNNSFKKLVGCSPRQYRNLMD